MSVAVDPGRRWSVAIVGAGPNGTSFLERLLASVDDLVPADVGLDVHVVDPHPAGGGRVWRHDQSALLRMNSLAQDVAMFPDRSSRIEGPIRTGPSLSEWAAARAADPEPAVDPTLVDELVATTGHSFPTRRLQNAYLGWVHDTVVAAAPARVRVCVHATTAIAVVDEARCDEPTPARQVVRLADGGSIEVDAVVVAIGHLDVEPEADEQRLGEAAAAVGLRHVPPGYTADLDLSAIEPGATVVLRGTGLAFVDAVVVLTEGRGGRFVPDGTDASGERLRYVPSGAEPRLVTGSRRGLPYRSKLGYPRQGPRLALPRFLTPAAVDALLASDTPTDFRRDLWPLVVQELTWAHLHELAHAHPERVALPWSAIDAAMEAAPLGDPELVQLLARAVPDPADRFDLAAIDAPLAEVAPLSLDALQPVVRAHIEADLARKADPRWSPDAAVFEAMLSCFMQIARAAASGRIDPRSRLDDIDGWWFGLFSTFASGPPPLRLQELLALSRAGVVQFLGRGLEVRLDADAPAFVATSASAPTAAVHATCLIEARLPRIDVARATDPLVRDLLASGVATEQLAIDGAGVAHPTGRFRVQGAASRLVDRDGRAHPRRFAIGVNTSRSAPGAFPRPGTDALSFRQHDAAARAVLTELATPGSDSPAFSARPHSTIDHHRP